MNIKVHASVNFFYTQRVPPHVRSSGVLYPLRSDDGMCFNIATLEEACVMNLKKRVQKSLPGWFAVGEISDNGGLICVNNSTGVVCVCSEPLNEYDMIGVADSIEGLLALGATGGSP